MFVWCGKCYYRKSIKLPGYTIKILKKYQKTKFRNRFNKNFNMIPFSVFLRYLNTLPPPLYTIKPVLLNHLRGLPYTNTTFE